ncbi:MAG: SMC family ATPase [Clostridia bacterium]
MKPVDLKMKAFGSYVEEEIHFADFSHGLFLITGETGAGKTMIFDAISFALFGTTSGNDRADHLRDLHCDRSELSEDTCVTLVFEQNGKQYTVERSIHFWKKRDTGELKSSMDAVLTEPDGTTIRGAKDTSERIKDLLHINAEQFRKIVMLAQGEFREFLKADSEEKNEILGRLFDNSAFKRYQEMLSGAKDLLEKERDENRRQLEALLKDGFAEEEMTDGQEMLFHPEHPELLKNLEGLVSADKEQLAALEEKRRTIQDELGALNKKHGAAERENADLDELKKNEMHLRELQDRETEIRRLQENVATTGRVLHSVKPAVDGWKSAKTNLESAGKDIEKQQQICDELNRVWTAARAAAEGDREAAEEA